MRRLRPPLRWLRALLALVGIVHLLVPGFLLDTAGRAYVRMLAVDFDPRDGATRRVRLVGLAFVRVAVLVPGRDRVRTPTTTSPESKPRGHEERP